MTFTSIVILIVCFLLASIVSVISGSTSLITVPLMLEFDIEPHRAIATNMLALTLMSLGGTIPFIGKGAIDTRRSPLLIILTLFSSLLGALLVIIISSKSMPSIIAISMFVVAGLSIIDRKAGRVPVEKNVSKTSEILGYITTFILGIYGGFFSGGYVTLLTAAYVKLFGMTFTQAIATTKLINVFSSSIATLIFIKYGIVDYQLGIILGLTMFVGGIIGGQITLKLSNVWLQRIYLTVVALLAMITWRKSQQERLS
jgi:uncharacterized protein